MIEINNENEMKKFYVKEVDTYVFNEDVKFYCNIDVDCDIHAYDIYAMNIKSNNIDSWDIKALDIYAKNIKAWNITTDDIDVDCDIKAKNIDSYNIKASNIDAKNIKAWDIKANNIDSWNINACDIDAVDIYSYDIVANSINANNISYFAICIAYEKLKCKEIKGRFKNSMHKCLCNAIEFIDNEEVKNDKNKQSR